MTQIIDFQATASSTQPTPPQTEEREAVTQIAFQAQKITDGLYSILSERIVQLQKLRKTTEGHNKEATKFLNESNPNNSPSTATTSHQAQTTYEQTLHTNRP